MTTPDAVPPADAAEQANEIVPDLSDAPWTGPDEVPLEADAADAAEQAAEVPIDEEEAPS